MCIIERPLDRFAVGFRVRPRLCFDEDDIARWRQKQVINASMSAIHLHGCGDERTHTRFDLGDWQKARVSLNKPLEPCLAVRALAQQHSLECDRQVVGWNNSWGTSGLFHATAFCRAAQ